MVVGYVRLSVKDMKTDCSNSILNQIDLIKDYCRNNGYTISKFYVDDGESGINYERPAFLNLKRDIEAHKVSVLIVKDISRLGREAYESSFYITEYFKSHNIRFIAIDDYIETDTNMKEMIVNIKSILNDNYIREASLKRKQVALNKTHNHEFIGPYPPYGYKIERRNGIRTLAIDYNCSFVVKNIFNLAAKGKSINSIVRTLNNNTFIFDIRDTQDYVNKSIWTYKKVLTIVKNRVYKGDLVVRKSIKNNYKQKNRNYIPYEYQTVIEGVFPSIVDKSLFNKANNTIRNYSKYNKKREHHELEGKVYCRICNRTMSYYRRYKSKKYEYYFRCPDCLKTVFLSKIDNYITSSFNDLVLKVDKGLIINNVLKMIDEYRKSVFSLLSESIKLMDDKISNLYFKKASGYLLADEFNFLKNELVEKRATIHNKYNLFSNTIIETIQIEKMYEKALNKINIYSYVSKVFVEDTLEIGYVFSNKKD